MKSMSVSQLRAELAGVVVHDVPVYIEFVIDGVARRFSVLDVYDHGSRVEITTFPKED